jgi:N-acetylglutamate synthase-like GNAT family acetyltransferase
MLTLQADEIKVISIEPAKDCDIAEISRMTEGEELLFRSPKEIKTLLSYFLVARDKNGEILACVGAKPCGEDLEIIALKKKISCQKKIGVRLVAEQLKRLKSADYHRIFALAIEPVAKSVFYPLGFNHVSLHLFSGKLKDDCRKCPKSGIKNEHCTCDEIALLYQG